ncbi:MAG: Uma2 family endonuclease [Phycisphaerae bacterium]
MALPAEKLEHSMTLPEYLTFEETSEVRHEFHDGQVLAMSGGTYAHARVTTNLTGTLLAKLRGTPCEVLDSNMRVAVARSRRFVYSDASIVCSGPVFHPEDPKKTTIINPRVLFEVLSDGTEAYDRGEKFEKYRQIDGLQEYILLSQHRPIFESYLRLEDGTWNFTAWEGTDAVAEVRAMDLKLPLSELYPQTAVDGVDPKP